MDGMRSSHASIQKRGNEVKNVPAEKRRKACKEEPAASAPRLLDSASSVESVVTTALTTSAQKMGLGDTDVFVTCLRKCDCVAVNYYCYSVTKGLGEVLGSWSKNIRAVYVCYCDDGTSGEDCIGNTSTPTLIHMIIWAEKKNKALNALIEAMDVAMVQRHRRLLGLNQLKHVLDAQVVDDEDVRNRTGYAVLLKSIHQPPIQVWRSSPDI